MNRKLVSVLVLLALCAGCGKSQQTQAKSPRIVTFAPHITDIAFDMGLGPHVVGVSSHCILPAGQQRTVMGNAFKINSETICSEAPDILFYNTRESDYDALRKLRPSLRLVRMRNGSLAELREGILAMGAAVGREDLSTAMVARMDDELADVAEAVAGRGRPRVLFVVGTEHPLTVGAGWLTHELIETAGGRNVAAELGLDNWANINLETVLTAQPDVLICQSEPDAQAVEQARAYWQRVSKLKAAAAGRVFVIGDRRLTIPGSKVAQSAAKLAAMIHPDAFEASAEGRAND